MAERKRQWVIESSKGESEGPTEGESEATGQKKLKLKLKVLSEETLAGPSREGTAGSDEETSKGSTEETLEGSSEETSRGSSEVASRGSSEVTSRGSGDETVRGSSEDTSLPSSEETSRGSGDETVRASSEDTLLPSSEETSRGSCEEIKAGPSREGVAGPSREGVAGPSREGVAGPSREEVERRRRREEETELRTEHEYSVGLNAWAEWIRLANTAIDKANVTGRRVRYYKSDIAQLNVDELNTYLCHFVRELVKPNGERYSCAALYYVVLGLNLYLIELGRVVNFISDDNFRVFSNSFHQLLLRYENRAIVGGRRLVWSRISEVILWDARQLGAHSPKVLLDTIMFFITKHFRLKATVHHANIRFKHIFRHILRKRNAGGSYRAYLQYYGPHPQSDNDYDSESDEDVGVPHYRIMRENNEDDSKCPVRLYEFFISKCPAAAIRNNNRLYLLPEKDYDPDGDVWFTQAPLPREIIARTVLKLKMIDELKD